MSEKQKRKRERIPKTTVLEWLQINHPDLWATAEVDRDWVWITENLKEDPTTRESIKNFGFVFAKRGGHPLPSGKLGTWGHSCERPLPFKRRGKGSPTTTKTTTPTPAEPEPEQELDPVEQEALAFAYAYGSE